MSRTRKGGKRRSKKALARSATVSRIKVAILCIVILIGCALVSVPLMRNIQSKARLEEKKAELADQKKNTEDLESRVREASTLEYVEREARKQRLVKAGEVLYLITPEDNEEESGYRFKSVESMEEAWDIIRKVINCSYRGAGREIR